MHTPVLTKEVVEFLNCRSGGIYVDATLGGGGLGKAILDASAPAGRLIGFDQDESALKDAGLRLEKFSGRFALKKARFSEIRRGLKKAGVGLVDGVLADLGLSSMQLDSEERGFSFLREGRLDMRMDRTEAVSAYELVNSSSAEELEEWFFEFGEERFSRRIARAIVLKRKRKPIETTSELAEIVVGAVPAVLRRGRIHPATRVFQALRMVVNDEIGELKRFVEAAPHVLNRGGRLVIISYHSLEDRIVKHAFREIGRRGEFKVLTKRPVRPGRDEILQNRRARSARLRALERVL